MGFPVSFLVLWEELPLHQVADLLGPTSRRRCVPRYLYCRLVLPSCRTGVGYLLGDEGKSVTLVEIRG